MIKVTAYQCKHCKKHNKTTLRKTKKGARSHELKCLWNPERRSCALCQKHYAWIDFEMQHVDRCKAGYNIKNKIKVECPDFSYCENHDIYEDLKIAILKIQNECKHEKTTVQHNSIYDGSDISYYCINCGAKKVNNDIFTFAENEFAYKALRKLKVR